MKTAKDVLKSIKDNDVKYVDLRFTDPRGKWQHVTFDVGMIEEESLPKARCSTAPRSPAGRRSTIRHVPDARPGHRDDRSVLREPPWSSPATCWSRPQASPTIATRGHGQEGRGDGQVDGRRRHHVLRTGSRVLRIRRRPLPDHPLQHRLQARLLGTADQFGYRV